MTRQNDQTGIFGRNRGWRMTSLLYYRNMQVQTISYSLIGVYR
jgi:hypothetical protein